MKDGGPPCCGSGCSASSSTSSWCSWVIRGDPAGLGKLPYGHAAVEGGRRRRGGGRRGPAGGRDARRTALARSARGHADGVVLAVHGGHVRLRRRRLSADDAPRADGHRPRHAHVHRRRHARLVRAPQPGRHPAGRTGLRPHRQPHPHGRWPSVCAWSCSCWCPGIRARRRSGCWPWASGSRSLSPRRSRRRSWAGCTGSLSIGLLGGFITTVHHVGGGFWAYIGGVIYDSDRRLRTGHGDLGGRLSRGPRVRAADQGSTARRARRRAGGRRRAAQPWPPCAHPGVGVDRCRARGATGRRARFRRLRHRGPRTDGRRPELSEVSGRREDVRSHSVGSTLERSRRWLAPSSWGTTGPSAPRLRSIRPSTSPTTDPAAGSSS